jgi:hypothetical protein
MRSTCHPYVSPIGTTEKISRTQASNLVDLRARADTSTIVPIDHHQPIYYENKLRTFENVDPIRQIKISDWTSSGRKARCHWISSPKIKLGILMDYAALHRVFYHKSGIENFREFRSDWGIKLELANGFQRGWEARSQLKTFVLPIDRLSSTEPLGNTILTSIEIANIIPRMWREMNVFF